MPELDPALTRRVFEVAPGQGDYRDALVLADGCLERGQLRLAAAALDRAFGLAPGDPDVARQRAAVLDSLALVEHGLRFRFIPGGPFLMGSPGGDPDERPVHVERTADFWMAEVPLTWAAFCELLGWRPPPEAAPEGGPEDQGAAFSLHGLNRIRLQYCETETRAARDWHSHVPSRAFSVDGGPPQTGPELFGAPPRENPQRPFRYDVKPVVAVLYEEAEALRQRLSTPSVEYRIPTEVEWEKAARGGLIGARYSWGNEPPDPSRCDCDHFGEFAVRAPTRYPPNGYGLYAMCGTVQEWTSDLYDALAYRPDRPPDARPAPAEGRRLGSRVRAPGAPLRVLRGGSWCDCPEACTVSFRASADAETWAPNIGVRLVRCERSAAP